MALADVLVSFESPHPVTAKTAPAANEHEGGKRGPYSKWLYRKSKGLFDAQKKFHNFVSPLGGDPSVAAQARPMSSLQECTM
jgi:hypothetical protein